MKKIILRAMLGAPIGIAIGHIITLFISVGGDGNFYPCEPSFVQTMGGELNAVAMQTLLCAIMGAGFAAASVIWESEKLSIAAQTGLALGIYSILMFPIAYFAEWMPHSLYGALQYAAIFLGMFAVIWVVQYFSYKSRLKKINSKLK